MRKKLSLLSTLFALTLLLLAAPLLTFSAAADETGEYVKTDLADIKSTDTVVITMTYKDGTVYAMENGNGTSKAPAATTVTVVDGKITSDVTDTLKWNISQSGDTFIIYPAGTTNTWLYCTNTNNGVRVGTNANKAFTIDSDSGYIKNVATSRYLGVYRTTPDWRCYTNTTGNTANQTLSFYVLTSTASSCEHVPDNGVTVDATCTKKGSITYACTLCGETVEVVELDMIPHSYTDGVCTACGFFEPETALSITDAIAFGQSFASDTYTDGKYYVTGVITEVYNETYGNMKITDESGDVLTIYGTYSADGSTRYDGMEIKPIAGDTVTVYGIIGNYNGTAQIKNGWITDHQQSESHEHVFADATCTEPKTCACGETEGEPLGHSFADATCTAPKTCTLCAVTEGETIDHSYADGVCTSCGAAEPSDEEPVSVGTLSFADVANRTEFSTSKQVWVQNGITFTNNKSSSTTNVANYSNPVRLYKSSSITVEYDNMTKIVFTANSASYATALATSIGDAATASGKVVTVELSAPANSFTVASLSAQIRLDSIEVYAIPAVSSASIDGAQIVIGESLSLRYYVTVSGSIADYEMVFTVNGKTFTQSGADAYEYGEQFVFTLSEIGPHQMSDNVSAVLTKGGETAAELAEYSIKKNATDLLATNGGEALNRLVSDLLYYGAASQTYRGYKTDDLATDGVEGLLEAAAAAPTEEDDKRSNTGSSADAAYFTAAGVKFDYINQIYVKLAATDIAGVTLTVNGIAAELTEYETGKYIAFSDGISATGFDTEYTFVLSMDGEEVASLTYSVNSYAYAKKDSTGAIKALTDALYNYGKSADAYAASLS